MKGNELQFDFHKIQLPLSHFHYDRFDTPDDELWGKWSVNFSTSPQGGLDRVRMSLDQAEVTFTRKIDSSLEDPKVLEPYTGVYETPTGVKVQVLLKDSKTLQLATPGQIPLQLVPYEKHKFRIKAFSDQYYEFVVEDRQVKALKVVTPSGQYQVIRK
jgi:hypothetical protein